MANNVDITLAADSKQAEKAYDKLQAENEKLGRQLDKIQDKSKRATDQNTNGMDRSAQATFRAGRELAGMVTQFFTLESAIKAAISEQEKFNRLQDEARKAIVDPANAIRASKFSFEADATLSEAGFEANLQKIAKRRNAKITQVAQIREFASSAKGSLDNATVDSAVDLALQIFPDEANVQDAAFAASRMLGIAKFSGTTDMRVNAGFLANLGIASHGKDMSAIGQHMVPAINQMVAFGDTQEQAGEIGSALSQLLQDDEMRITSTAIQQLGQQLKEFNIAPDKKGRLMAKDARGVEFEVPREQLAALHASKSTQERMAVMQQNPELFRAFEATASFETKSKQAIFAMVRGDEVAMREIEQARKTVRGTVTPEDRAFQANLTDERIKFFNAGSSAVLQQSQRGVESALGQADFANTPGARMASARDAFKRLLNKTDLPGVDLFQEQGMLLNLQFGERTLGEDEVPEAPALKRMRRLRDELQKLGRTDDVEKFNAVISEVEAQSRAFEAMPSGFAGVGTGIAGAATQARQAGRDPQMDEQTAVLNDISRKLDRQTSDPPRQTERPASRLSRGAN